MSETSHRRGRASEPVAAEEESAQVLDRTLDEALAETFPASDAVAIVQHRPAPTTPARSERAKARRVPPPAP